MAGELIDILEFPLLASMDGAVELYLSVQMALVDVALLGLSEISLPS